MVHPSINSGIEFEFIFPNEKAHRAARDTARSVSGFDRWSCSSEHDLWGDDEGPLLRQYKELGYEVLSTYSLEPQEWRTPRMTGEPDWDHIGAVLKIIREHGGLIGAETGGHIHISGHPTLVRLSEINQQFASWRSSNRPSGFVRELIGPSGPGVRACLPQSSTLMALSINRHLKTFYDQAPPVFPDRVGWSHLRSDRTGGIDLRNSETGHFECRYFNGCLTLEQAKENWYALFNLYEAVADDIAIYVNFLETLGFGHGEVEEKAVAKVADCFSEWITK